MTDNQKSGSGQQRLPGKYRVVDWSAIPENLVDAVRVGDYPPGPGRTWGDRFTERVLMRISRATEELVRAAVTETQWPTAPTEPQRRIMDLIVRAEETVDGLIADAGSRRKLLDTYPETKLTVHLDEIAIGGYQLVVAESGAREISPRLRCTVDSEAELSRRVEALERFAAAVREDRARAA